MCSLLIILLRIAEHWRRPHQLWVWGCTHMFVAVTVCAVPGSCVAFKLGLFLIGFFVCLEQLACIMFLRGALLCRPCCVRDGSQHASFNHHHTRLTVVVTLAAHLHHTLFLLHVVPCFLSEARTHGHQPSLVARSHYMLRPGYTLGSGHSMCLLLGSAEISDGVGRSHPSLFNSSCCHACSQEKTSLLLLLSFLLSWLAQALAFLGFPFLAWIVCVGRVGQLLWRCLLSLGSHSASRHKSTMMLPLQGVCVEAYNAYRQCLQHLEDTLWGGRMRPHLCLVGCVCVGCVCLSCNTCCHQLVQSDYMQLLQAFCMQIIWWG